MRILCLHDTASCAIEFQQSLNLLEQRLRLKHDINLIFVDAPLASNDNDKQSQILTTHQQLERETLPTILTRSWYTYKYNYAHNQTYSESPEVPTGFDASILHLQQIWNNAVEPFCGVLGIGQGATLAAIMPLFKRLDTLEKGRIETCPIPMFHGLKFLILLHYRNELSLSSSLLDLSTHGFPKEVYSRLHIFREDDHDGLMLYEACGATEPTDVKEHFNQVLIVPSESDLRTMSVPMMNAIGRFLVQQKKKQDEHLYSSDEAIETIRQKIFRLEEEALSLINSSIQENPPKSLLAVVSQRQIGGWTGDRDAFRTREFVEAGGAPCPATFKLPRAHR